MNGRCERGPASPLAERAGYVPRAPAPEGWRWWCWCDRPCVDCGSPTCNDDGLCRSCNLDLIQGFTTTEEYEAKHREATEPFGVCGARP